MFETYYLDGSVRPEFNKEFVSIFDGWLGKENLDQLDQVTGVEWSRFNTFLDLLKQGYGLYSANLMTGQVRQINDLDTVIVTHEASLEKQSSQFTQIVIPELGALYKEEWDYTWILWHKNNGAVETLDPLIRQAGLFHWSASGG